ncbi:hypothetical protein PQ478_21490 (plasmid) [Alkalihalophilus pseudofirmus]|uniref:hypothetical protein n=1 Tax=Alkalihalophilus pseudofirmus TaxID=79885 RepID=UPI00259BC1FE|nr:hypothetical protein [Alkalihalophilus pseudofirmus]WEG19263.1 hypothetical protein PQ478_21490 [Alkalihalophilus pseudofirmus]
MSYYIGNGAYCYSNSVSMLLSTINENIAPASIEVASGFSLGASLERNKMLFFDNGLSSPDKGVNLAFENLGFSVVEKVQNNDGSMPIDQLRNDLEISPVMLGPVDMGYLKYLPNHEFLGGCDHYVLALEIGNDKILLHDPAGYPYVWLSLENLEKAWKAESITWSYGAYRCWKSPKRIEKPSENDIYNKSIQLYKRSYKEQRNQSSFGSYAIKFKAEQIRNTQISDEEKGHLLHFAFPLGSRRAIDFSNFLNERNNLLSTLKEKQAKFFGECYTYASFGEWNKVADTLEALAETEFEFEESILNHS